MHVKYGLLVGFLVACFVGVVALQIYDGLIVPRTFLEGRDFSDQSLSCQHEGNRWQLFEQDKGLIVTVSCFVPKLIDEDLNVLVEREQKDFFVPFKSDDYAIRSFKSCLDANVSVQECWTDYQRPQIVEKVERGVNRIRVKLQEWADYETMQDFNGITPEDFNFEGVEVNP